MEFDSKVIFWIIIAILFFILYWRSKSIRSKFEEDVLIKIGDKVVTLTTDSGDLVFYNPKESLNSVFRAMDDIYKLSEVGLLISAIAAVISALL